ncbi:MAG: hypothetical protein WD738_08225 [Pirellulales bacterium]
MSLPDLSSDRPRGVLVRKPQTTIYTVLLFIALMAVIVSCLLLVLELLMYDFQFKPPANLRSAVVVAPLELPFV